MKSRLFILLMLVIALRVNAQVQIFDITTGVDNGGIPIPAGNNDDTWDVQVAGGGFADAISTVGNTSGATCNGNLNFSWAVNSCGRWISPVVCPNGSAMTSQPAVNYTYRTIINVSNANCITAASVNFNWIGADNGVVNILFNNVSYAVNQPTAHIPLNQTNPSIQIAPGDVLQGLNTLDVVVQNSSGAWTGFFCCGNVSITNSPPLSPSFTTNAVYCEGEPLSFVGSDGAGTATNYFWDILEVDQWWNPIPGGLYWGSWFPGTPGAFTFPMVPECGKYYKIKLAVQNSCENWVETSHLIYISCGPETNLGPDQVGCIQTGVPLVVSPCNANFNYGWTTPGFCQWGGCNALACNSGTYCVTATDPANGCTSTDCVNITLEDCSGCSIDKFSPSVEINDDDCATAHFDIALDAGPGTTISSILWDFGDGNSSNLQNPSHTYLYNGTYLVTVTVYAIGANGDCCVVDKEFFVSINCQCKVLEQQPAVTPLENCGCFEFSIAPINVSGTTQPAMIRWDFGDGTFGFGETVTHCYDANGGYQATLYISGFNGKECCDGDLLIMGIPVDCSFECKVEPKFDWTVNNGVYQFNNLSFGYNGTNLVGYFWDFGDGSTSSDANPSHEFPGPGSYYVCLTVYGWTGEKCCYEKVCEYIDVPEFMFGAQNKSLLNPEHNNNGSSLQQNAPNPFDSNTTIRYSLPNGYRDARIEIYTAEGKLMQTYRLTDEEHGQLNIEGNTYQPGMYIYRLIVDQQIQDSKRMVLLRN